MRKIAIIDIDNTLWQFSDPFYLELKKNGIRLFQNLIEVPDHILKASS